MFFLFVLASLFLVLRLSQVNEIEIRSNANEMGLKVEKGIIMTSARPSDRRQCQLVCPALDTLTHHPGST
uniref:Putative secreted protein n=1 Tax=Anopheles darlingi TaxID=43151 RepID=A0A2M4DA39_ANODA